MIKLLLIRHGETFSNAEKRYAGHQDIGLTEKGIWQAEQLAERLAEVPLKAIYCSDLERAIHTATIINSKHQLDLKIEPLFREIHFGEWEGLCFDEVKNSNENHNYWMCEPHLPLPGGESMSGFKRRVLDGLDKIIAKHNNSEECETIAIVCHGGVTRIIISNALNIPLEKVWFMRQDSTNLNILYYYKEDIYFVETINDTNHLNNKEERMVN